MLSWLRNDFKKYIHLLYRLLVIKSAGFITPLTMVQNAAAHLGFNQTRLLMSLSIALSSPTQCHLASTYQNSLIQAPPRSAQSANQQQLVLLSLLGRKSQSKLFSCVVPPWLNEFPNSLSVLKNRLKTYLF